MTDVGGDLTLRGYYGDIQPRTVVAVNHVATDPESGSSRMVATLTFDDGTSHEFDDMRTKVSRALPLPT